MYVQVQSKRWIDVMAPVWEVEVVPVKPVFLVRGAAGDPRPGGRCFQGFLPCGQAAIQQLPGLTLVG
jgi:hypothetical protein